MNRPQVSEKGMIRLDSNFQLDMIVDNDIDLDGYGACEGTLVNKY
jgi:hypothetical protein